jgi:hypothetical protein
MDREVELMVREGVGQMGHEVGQMAREQLKLVMEVFVSPGAGRVAETNG